MVDQKQQQKSELFAISSDLDFYWYSVCESEKQDGDTGEGGSKGEGRKGHTLTFEELAFLKKKDLCAELRRQDCGEY